MAGVDQLRGLGDLVTERAALAASGQWQYHEAVTPVSEGSAATPTEYNAGRVSRLHRAPIPIPTKGLLPGVTQARDGRAVAPKEDDSDPATEGSERRSCEILQCCVSTGREMLEIL